MHVLGDTAVATVASPAIGRWSIAATDPGDPDRAARLAMALWLTSTGMGIVEEDFITAVTAEFPACQSTEEQQQHLARLLAGIRLFQSNLGILVPSRAYRVDSSWPPRVGGNGVVLRMVHTASGGAVALKLLVCDPPRIPATIPAAVSTGVARDGEIQVMEMADTDMHEIVACGKEPHPAVEAFSGWANDTAAAMFASTDGCVCPDWKLANVVWFEGYGHRAADVDSFYSDTEVGFAIDGTYPSVPVEAASNADDYGAMATAVVATAYAVEVSKAIAAGSLSPATCMLLTSELDCTGTATRGPAARLVAMTLADLATESNELGLCGALVVLGIYSSWASLAVGDDRPDAADFVDLKQRLRMYFGTVTQ